MDCTCTLVQAMNADTTTLLFYTRQYYYAALSVLILESWNQTIFMCVTHCRIAIKAIERAMRKDKESDQERA